MDKVITKSSARDFFLYLFSTFAIWIVATNFGTIIFQIINIYIPDVTRPEQPYSRDLIRWSMASLIVVFPVYIVAMRFLNRDVRNFPEKADLKIRKWLLNLTLFLAAIVIISDLISLVYNFLEGELTLRFFLKVTTIFVISASIISYYRKLLKSDNFLQPSFVLSTFPKIVIGVLATSIIISFFLVGSPESQRLVRFDKRRVNDLSIINHHIRDYWMNNQKLPDSIDDLKSPNITIPVDPKTKANYGYKILDRDSLKYEICANFETSNREFASGHWSVLLHDAEYTCFEKMFKADKK
ncbi:MAG: DUF5671 domain-containing protein [Candidatus Hodarchaeales archaeon]|jgi:hypothetical protein